MNCYDLINLLLFWYFRYLASVADLLTTEIEHVNVDILEALENEGKVVQPNSRTLRIIQVFDLSFTCFNEKLIL